MSRTFSMGPAALIVLSLIVLPGRTSAQDQSVSATLQFAGPPAVYVSSTLAKTNEAGSGFFTVSGTAIRLGDTTYQMQADSGAVKSGSTVTLKSSGGFLSCCIAAKLTTTSTLPGATEKFTVTFYDATQVRTMLAKRAADKNRGAKAAADRPPNIGQ
jgi:hypothetical protein